MILSKQLYDAEVKVGQTSELIFYLKKAIRAQGLTYKELADRLDVSESTLKRWFSKYNFSIEKLDDICAALSLNLEDIIPSRRERMEISYLTEAQELELADDEMFFGVFYLVIAGVNAQIILERFNLTLAKLRSYLSRLDEMGLIELHPYDRVVLLVNQNVRWLPQGPLNTKYGEKIRSDFMNIDFTGKHEQFWLLSGKISSASLQVFSRKLDALLDEFQNLINLDKNLPDTMNITFFAAHRPWVFPLLRDKKKSTPTSVPSI